MKVLFITPPMTQLNTPYPATAYLTGFLKKQGYAVSQRDLAIDLVLSLLSQQGLQHIFNEIEQNYADYEDEELPDPIYHFMANFSAYQHCIEPTIKFLQGKNPTLAPRIASRSLLPEGSRFDHLYDMEELNDDLLGTAFGQMGVQDKAKFLATLFIDDLADVIQQGIDPNFQITRYGESLASSNSSFDALYEQLQQPQNLIDHCINELVKRYLQQEQPEIIGLTVPFPGNLLGALKIARSCKQINPNLIIEMGGGYVNTELRSLQEPRIFQYIDYITLDDGERPILTLLEYLTGQRSDNELFRTYRLINQQVVYSQNHTLHDIPHKDTGTPSYQGLNLDHYLSLCEMLNPMHRIWSDGRWNKLTVAKGCYWAKCSFCDINLNYIHDYDAAGANLIVDRIEQLIQETGETGFHFVDEAAPPKALFAMAEKLIERDVCISWWGNIRFEKTFNAEQCQLLADSGCIAMSGGLEVASNRLLQLMKKGVSVEQVAQVTKNFSEAGILVHAYLMYGFPSQTEQETVDALEMVRQMMALNCFQSAYWHRFAATIHSPVGLHPEQYGIQLIPNQQGRFAENDIDFIDPTNADHAMLGKGLNKALYNYMHNMGFEIPANHWFEKPLQQTHIAPDFIETALSHP